MRMLAWLFACYLVVSSQADNVLLQSPEEGPPASVPTVSEPTTGTAEEVGVTAEAPNEPKVEEATKKEPKQSETGAQTNVESETTKSQQNAQDQAKSDANIVKEQVEVPASMENEPKPGEQATLEDKAEPKKQAEPPPNIVAVTADSKQDTALVQDMDVGDCLVCCAVGCVGLDCGSRSGNNLLQLNSTLSNEKPQADAEKGDKGGPDSTALETKASAKTEGIFDCVLCLMVCCEYLNC